MERQPAPDTAVLVVGAGPTGLLLACELCRRGIDCLLVDAYDAPLGWDRATVIHPRSLQIFESLGVVGEFLDAGVIVRGSRFFSDGESLGGFDFTANLTRYPFDLGLSEETTERIVAAYLERHGGAVTRSTRLLGLEPGPDAVTATLEAHGERREVTVSWLIGCDGYRRLVRDLAGIAYLGGNPDEPWAVFDASFTDTRIPLDIITGYYDDPLVILTPLPGGLFRVAHVSRGEAHDVLLDSYEAERRPVAERIVESGVAVDANLVRLDAAARAVRNARVRAVFADPDAVRTEAVAGAEVDRDYQGSRIVSGADRAEVVGGSPGRLLPRTAVVRLSDGTSSLLHELTNRTGYTLLVLGGLGAGVDEVTAVLDRLGSVSANGFLDAAYGSIVGVAGGPRVGSIDTETAAQLDAAGLSVLVVRPDRYVGMRRDGADTEGTAYLAEYLDTLAA
jgi:2-polyprenyl-6-methoxyphenol hydroxylase-like FAD-dependent oxidoreductase